MTQKLVDPTTRRDGWRGVLVLARIARVVPPFAAHDPALVPAALGQSGRFALDDASDASRLDGPGVLNQHGLDGSVAGQSVGAPDDAGVVFLLKTAVGTAVTNEANGAAARAERGGVKSGRL